MFAENIMIMLKSLGVSAWLKGYRYLKEAVLYVIKNNDYDIRITKEVYPYIAKRYKTKTVCVERSIRHAITQMWLTSDTQIQRSLFGRAYPDKVPSNKEFIFIIAEHILHEVNIGVVKDMLAIDAR